MTTVISDTTAITHLLQINRLYLLPALFQRIYIPPAVWSELCASENQEAAIEKLSWLIVRQPSLLSIEAVGTTLDQGETEAIALAFDLKADLLIIDEAAGRLLAAGRSIEIIGILGLLVLAKKSGLLENVRPVINELLASNFRMNVALIQRVLDEVGE